MGIAEKIKYHMKFIRKIINKLFKQGGSDSIPILYGGSVNSKNSKLISKIGIVNGFLIGGASLKINEFNQIIS